MTAAAIAHGTVPFPVGEVHGSQFTALDAILGEEFAGPKGAVYRRCQAAAAQTSATNLVYKRNAAGSDTVAIGAQSADVACGVTVSDQVDIALGDYFFLQVAGEVTLNGKTSHGLAAGDGVKIAGTGAGKVEVDGTTGTWTSGGNVFPCMVHTVVSTNVFTAYIQGKLMGYGGA